MHVLRRVRDQEIARHLPELRGRTCSTTDSTSCRVAEISGIDHTSFQTRGLRGWELTMSLTALALLMTSALLHAGWNLLLKQAGEKYLVTWWALMIGSVLFLPVLLFSEPPPLSIWGLACLSGLTEAAYFGLLAAAYRVGDFSLVYPVARGAAPLLLACWSVLFLNERPTAGGWFGLSLLVAGLVIVGSSALWQKHIASSRTSITLALAVALLISAYSAIDGFAVRDVSPLSYTALVMGFTSLFVTPLILWRYERRLILSEWRTHWRRITIIGVMSLTTYLLVLTAYSMAPVGYAGAIREISVVLASLAGWLWLGEPMGTIRVIGAAVIFGGILVIAIAG